MSGSSSMGERVQQVRAALVDFAQEVGGDRPTCGPEMRAHDRDHLGAALRAHGIELDEDLLDIAHQTWARRTFMGGNYTLDAKAILAAVDAASAPTPPPVSHGANEVGA